MKFCHQPNQPTLIFRNVVNGSPLFLADIISNAYEGGISARPPLEELRDHNIAELNYGYIRGTVGYLKPDEWIEWLTDKNFLIDTRSDIEEIFKQTKPARFCTTVL